MADRDITPRRGARLILAGSAGVRGTLGTDALDAAAVAALRGMAESPVGAVRLVDLAAPTGTVRLLLEVHRAPEELLIVGAGHIAVPLAELGAMLGFRVRVIDDRDEFATGERFPAAAEVVRMDFDDPFRDSPIGARTHVLLVTRAHRYDYDCLRRLLAAEAPPASIGMIGSRRRVRAAFEALERDGVPREALARVRAPVGLDIGAETPAEIAVSIAAELIRMRRAPGATAAPSLGATARVVERLPPREAP